MRRLIIRTCLRTVFLKQLVPADAKPYFDLVDRARPHLSKYDDTTAEKYPDEASVLESILHPKNPRKLRFGVWEGNTLVGMVGLTPLGKGKCETGRWTGEEFCRMGYGTVSRNALAGYARRRLGFRRIIAKTHPENIESQGMLARARYQRFRRTKQSHYFLFVGPVMKPRTAPVDPHRAFRQLERAMPRLIGGNVNPS